MVLQQQKRYNEAAEIFEEIIAREPKCVPRTGIFCDVCGAVCSRSYASLCVSESDRRATATLQPISKRALVTLLSRT